MFFLIHFIYNNTESADVSLHCNSGHLAIVYHWSALHMIKWEPYNFFSSDTRMCVLICKCSFKKTTKNVAITINKNILCNLLVRPWLSSSFIHVAKVITPPSRFPQSIILSFLKIIINTHRCIKWPIKTSNLILLMHVWYVSL